MVDILRNTSWLSFVDRRSGTESSLAFSLVAVGFPIIDIFIFLINFTYPQLGEFREVCHDDRTICENKCYSFALLGAGILLG